MPRHALFLLTSALVLAGLIGGIYQASAADGTATPAEIKRQFDRHNYKQALKLAEDYVKANPSGAAVVDVQMVRAESLLKLRRYPDGKKLLLDLFDKYPKVAKQPGPHETLGDAAQQRGDSDTASKHWLKAADLYEAQADKRKAADLLFKIAELHDFHESFPKIFDVEVPEGKDPQRDWRVRREIHTKIAVAVLERIVGLSVDDKTTAEALFRQGQKWTRLGQPEGYEKAITVWRRLVRDLPRQDRAAEASYHIAQTYESRLHDYVQAVKEYEKTRSQFGGSRWARSAAKHIESIKAPRLGLRVQGPELPGKKAEIHWTTRNLKQVDLKAYKVELLGMIRKLHRPEEFHEWTPSEPAVATWTFEIPDQGKHQHFNSGNDNLKPTNLPVTDAGAYVVVGTARSREGKGVRAVALVLVSQIGVVSKTAKGHGLVWAVDSLSGHPKAETKVLVQRRERRGREWFYRYADGETNDSGLYRVEYETKRDRMSRQLAFVIRSGDHYAMCRDLYEWGWWGYRYPHRVYGFTDRPVYRPEQTVHFKQIIRKHEMGQYENAANEKVLVRIRDAKNNAIYEQSLTTNKFGSVSGEVTLGEEPPLGVYRIEVQVGKRTYRQWECKGNRFRVEEYKKPEYTVEVAAGKPSYRVGDEITIDVKARYYFGEPVTGADVEYELWKTEYHPHYQPPMPFPWYFKAHGGRPGYPTIEQRGILPPHRGGARRELVKRGQAKTDDKGVATIGPIKTEPYENNPEVDLQYEVTARVVDKSRREIRGSGSVKVTHAPFFIHLRPQRYLYKPGDNAQVDIVAKGPNGGPIPFKGKARIHRLRSKLVEKDGREYREYELGEQIHEADVTVGKDGRGRFRYLFDEEGHFRATVSTQTDQGDEVTGHCDLWIAERGGEYAHFAYRDIELVLDRDAYEIGQTMRLLINTRHEDAYVLLTMETDELLLERIIFVKGKSKLIELPMERRHAPNVYLSAMALRDDKIYEDRRQVIVPPTHQFITVEAEPNKKSYLPREKGEVKITARDSNGKPIAAELAVMMVDASVYYIQPEFRKHIQEAFYGNLRPLLVTTRSSFAYRQHAYGRLHDFGARGGRALGRRMKSDAVAELSMAREPMMKKPAAAAPAPQAEANAEEKAAPAVKEAMVRSEFADSVVWAAHLVTDADGTATVDVPMPDNLTTWTLHAIACDKQTRVGEGSVDVVTRKNLIVRLEAPRFLVEKDLVYVSAIAHNYLDSPKKARIELKVTPQLTLTDVTSEGKFLDLDGKLTTPTHYRRWVEVPADGEVRTDFVCQAKAFGKATLLAKALTDEESDAMQVELPVLEYGADKFLAQAGFLPDEAETAWTAALHVPADIKPNTQSLDVRTNPSIAAVMIDAMPYLLGYPYGCTEQTLSRFVPAVVTAKSLQKLGIRLEDIRKKIESQGGPKDARLIQKLRRNPVYSSEKLDDMIRAGLKRLADLQKPDGGWGWWKHDQSNPYMTAYAVYALTEAREADVSVDAGIIRRGVAFLKKQVVRMAPMSRYRWLRDDRNVRAWMLFALASENPGNIRGSAEVRKALDAVYEKRDDLTDYGRALLAIALAKTGDRRRAGIVIENFQNTVRVHEDTQTVSWGRTTGWWWWYDNGTETTAAVLRAYLAVDPEHKYVPMIVRWLVRSRRGARWCSTKETAFCVYALSDYLQASGELDPDMTVTVLVDGKVRNELRVTKANVLALDTSALVGPTDLAPGEHEIRILKKGRGVIYASSYLRYYTREDPIKGAGHEVTVQRSYVRLVPKEVTKTRTVWDRKERKRVSEQYQTIEYEREAIEAGAELASGTLIEVDLRIEAKNNFEYMLFEDPKPAGCEPVRLVSGSTYGGGTYCNLELRDEHVAFFATYLRQGTHKLTYKLRCETPGVFNALPSRAEAMYAPLVRAISDSAKMAIVERK